MRLPRVALFFDRKPLEAIERSGDSSRTTHGALVPVDACRYLGALIVGAVSGVCKEELFGDHYCPVTEHWQAKRLSREIGGVASGSFKRKNPADIKAQGVPSILLRQHFGPSTRVPLLKRDTSLP